MVNPTHEQIRLGPQARLQTFIDSLARILARQWLDDERNRNSDNDQSTLSTSDNPSIQPAQ
jgi:hypothetical protein